MLESLFNKFGGLKACNFNFIKKRLQYRCIPVNIAKFLRTAFFIEHLWWLLPNIPCFSDLKNQLPPWFIFQRHIFYLFFYVYLHECFFYSFCFLMRPFIGGGLDIFLFKESSAFLIWISAYFSTCVKLKLLWIMTPSRRYFRN